ncbi:peptidase M56 family protein [Paenarthrobacter sp. NPDC092416]|uniref:peptidase M56 family protein n=1 Tax=Paenarthrobacter sp. NPDC092416 TaxID=3364386 RepID=UPI0037FA8B20
MNDLKVDERFSQALRSELVSRVEKTRTGRSWGNSRWGLGAGVFAGAVLVGGAGAAAAGLLTIPGAPVITPLGSPVTVSYSGPATVRFGAAPEGAKSIRVKLTCLTTGSWAFESGATSTCKSQDLKGPGKVTQFQIPIVPGKESTTINTQAQSQWQVTWTFVDEEPTPWATNAHGETYGAQNDKGLPQLVAVKATNGRPGYVYNAELEDATGMTAALSFKTREEALAWQEQRKGRKIAIPVYESDGKTVVGEFVISNDDEGPTGPLTDSAAPGS